jgi:arylsulfatase A-like enzyme
MIALVATLLASAPGTLAPASEPPNVLILLLDDVGIDQFASYDEHNGYREPKGYPYAHLPNMDALAARGVRFEQCRTMPVCSPSRATILAGTYPFRHGVGRSVYPDFATEHFRELGVAPSPPVALLPTLLAPAGYRSAAIGKWHLALEGEEGGTLDSHPLDLGFDDWRGPPRNLMDPGSPPPSEGVPHGYHNYWWVEDGEREQLVGRHASRHTCERAADWIRTGPEPWFCYVAFNACHAPLDVGNWPAEGHGFGAEEPRDGWRNTRYRATLEHLDHWIGELLGAAGDNTVVFLLGDNGTRGPTFKPREDEPRYPSGHPRHRPGDESAPFSAAPYSPQRAKQTVFESAVRVPLIVAGPGIAAPGRSSAALVDSVDLVPTILSLAGAPLPEHELDGIDFTDVLTDSEAPGARTWSFAEYFWPNGAVGPDARVIQRRAYLRRDGEHLWKVIHSLSNETEERLERRTLFLVGGPTWTSPDGTRSFEPDPFEQTDLGRQHPEFKATNRALKELVGDR